MKTKVEKLENVYEYLRNQGIIHTKKEFSNQIQFDYSNLTSAFNRSEKHLTDGLFKKICEKFPFFNIEYFLEDKGEMLKENYQDNNVSKNKGIVGINGNGHHITNNDISEIKELLSPIITLIEKKDIQVENIMTILKSKDEQINRLIGIIESWKKE
jgi:DNA-binding transcriptional regulator YhcF (GntR family)